jgi:excisionase family DNA binding protein
VTANEHLATAKDRIRSTRPLVVRAAEAAKMLSLNHSALYGLLMSGDVKSFKVGHRRLIPVRELEEFVARRLSEEW